MALQHTGQPCDRRAVAGAGGPGRRPARGVQRGWAPRILDVGHAHRPVGLVVKHDLVVGVHLPEQPQADRPPFRRKLTSARSMVSRSTTSLQPQGRQPVAAGYQRGLVVRLP
jgi:hypothetical protein